MNPSQVVGLAICKNTRNAFRSADARTPMELILFFSLFSLQTFDQRVQEANTGSSRYRHRPARNSTPCSCYDDINGRNNEKGEGSADNHAGNENGADAVASCSTGSVRQDQGVCPATVAAVVMRMGRKRVAAA